MRLINKFYKKISQYLLLGLKCFSTTLMLLKSLLIISHIQIILKFVKILENYRNKDKIKKSLQKPIKKPGMMEQEWGVDPKRIL
jgi:hypothetical protein